MRFNQWNLIFESVFPTWVVVVMVAALGISLWFTWKSSVRLGVLSKRLGLLALRALALVAVLVLLLRPTLDLRHAEELPGVIAVLVDRSASMSIASGEQSRLEMVQKSLRDSQDFFKFIGKKNEVEFVAFSDHIEATTATNLVGEDFQARATHTDIGQALKEIQNEFSSTNRALSAVVLLSDGADRGTLATRLQTKGDLSWLDEYPVPIYSYQPGKSGEFRDLRIERSLYDDFGFVKTPLVIEVDVVMEGYEPRTVPLTLKEGKEVLATTSVKFQKGERVRRAKIQFSPQQLGDHIYTVHVPIYSDEMIRDNNEHSFVIRVIRDKVRVLHVAGSPSWDEKFLRVALRRDPNIDLIAFYILRTKEDVIYDVRQDELSLIPFPHEDLFGPELKTFDLVIFQNFDYRKFFPKVYLENVRRFVLGGGGFMMFGGAQSFLGGGYQQTPLSEVLPFTMNSATQVFQNVSYRMGLTAVGKRHPVTRLFPNVKRNDEIWRTMPELHGLNEVGGLLPGSVLLGQVAGSGKKQKPLLAVREVGKGRTLALSTDTSWHWNFLRIRDGGTSDPYHRWIGNAIRWLIGDPTEALVDVQTKQMKWREGDRVEVVVSARDRRYEANANAKVQFEVVREPGVVVLEKEGKTDVFGRYKLTVPVKKKGHYRIRAKVNLPAGGLAAGETVLVIEGIQGEWLNPTINEDLLRFIAEKTGGKHKILPAKIDFEVQPKYNYKILERTLLPLWNHWVSFLLVSGLLMGEWWWRRRKGLA